MTNTLLFGMTENDIGVDGVKALSEALKKHTDMQKLWLGRETSW